MPSCSRIFTNVWQILIYVLKSGPTNGGGNNQTKSSCTEIFMRSYPKLLIWIIAIDISGHHAHQFNSTSSIKGKGQQTAIIGRLCETLCDDYVCSLQ